MFFIEEDILKGSGYQIDTFFTCSFLNWAIFCEMYENMTYLGRVVHDGLRIVRNSVVDGAELGELTDVWAQVLVQDSDVIVSVMSLLLVPHSQGVTDLVDGDTELQKNIYQMLCHVEIKRCIFW